MWSVRGKDGERRDMIDSFDKWKKVLLIIFLAVFLWAVVMITIMSFYEMGEPHYCPNCGSVIGEE